MKFKSKIEIYEDGSLYNCLLPELKESKNQRSTIDIKKTKEGVEIIIKAMDIIALKARSNSIIKLIEVYEKAKNE